MKMLQNIFNELLTASLNLLWRKWSAIGIAGTQTDMDNSPVIIDPEPLLLFSLSICRYDPRLYDEILDWLKINGSIINTQRLVTIQQKYNFNSGPQISSAAKYLSGNKEYKLKWEKVSSLYKEETHIKLFLSSRGKELPVKNPDPVYLEKGIIRNSPVLRGYSKEFPKTGTPSLLLRMRALFGINARSELICVLGSVPEIHPAEAARYTGYEKRSVQSILLDLLKSGILECRTSGKEKYYRLVPGKMNGLLPDNFKWIQWAPLLKGVEILFKGINLSLNTDDPLILSSELRSYHKESEMFFNESSTGLFLSDSSMYPGEQFIDIFKKDIMRIVNLLNDL